MSQKGLSAILIIIALLTHAIVFAVGYQFGKSDSTSIANKNIIKDHPIVNVASSDREWQEYQTDKFKISYPSNWSIDSQTGLEKGASFTSDDYQSNAAGLVGEGLKVSFRIDWRGFSSNWGLASSDQVDWLGNKATLNVYKAEGNDLVLHTNINGIDYEMVMFASSDVERESNKATFLKSANSIILK
jgi:hypothetical protein